MMVKTRFMDRSAIWGQILWKIQKCKMFTLFETFDLKIILHEGIIRKKFLFKSSCLKQIYVPLRMGSAKTTGVLKIYTLQENVNYIGLYNISIKLKIQFMDRSIKCG